MKIDRAKAKYTAYTDAEEFVRGHGEEGGQYQEDYDMPLEVYFSEMRKLADKLGKEADKIYKKYLLK